jgi:nicotinamidase-related amidase
MRCVLVIDMLRDFLEPDGALFCERCRTIIPKVKELLHHARRSGWPVIYVCDSHPPGSRDPDVLRFGPHAVRGTSGAEVITELAPAPGDHMVLKRTYDGFYNTDLEMTLRSLQADTVIISGIHTHVCVLATSLGAFHRGFRVIVLEDCTQASSEEKHRSRLDFIRSHVGDVMDLESLIRNDV